MSQALAQPANCCTPCADPVVENIPGPAGDDGADGAAGTNGVNAFTDTTADFTQPAVSANVIISVGTSAWAVVGQEIFVEGGGYYLVVSKPTAASIEIENLGYDANAAPTTIIASGSHVGPAGEKGATGATGSSGTTILTTKGDILSHDGAAAGRLGVGTDGKVLAADSAQVLGVVWNTVQPNAATDNGIARYDGTVGKPVPLQDSKVVITDDGAVQASGSGGNARGARAVDLQVIRVGATEVASGVESVIAGGKSNLASATNATVGGGLTNIASGAQSTVAGGTGNNVSGQAATIGGGNNNLGSGIQVVVAGGNGNDAQGDYSSILGGSGNLTLGDLSTIIGGYLGITDLYGQIAHSSGRFQSNGDAQASELIWRNTTTNATPTELFLDGATERAVIRDGLSWIFKINIIARDQTSGDTAAWEVKGALTRAGLTTVMVAAATVALVGADAGSIAAGWGLVGNVAVTANDTDEALKISVTGAGGVTIRWVAHARTVEVS